MAKKYTFAVKKSACMGCHACEVACKMEHGLGVGPRLIHVIERSPEFLPVYCHHCAKAPCIEACPQDAIYRTTDGVVLIDEAKCIGCRECSQACPFDAMQFNDDREVAVKCDLCQERLAQGLEPACVSTCPTFCIRFDEKTGRYWQKVAGDLGEQVAVGK
jgi:formate dehydrogenase iron-sulfur subunit